MSTEKHTTSCANRKRTICCAEWRPFVAAPKILTIHVGFESGLRLCHQGSPFTMVVISKRAFPGLAGGYVNMADQDHLRPS